MLVSPSCEMSLFFLGGLGILFFFLFYLFHPSIRQKKMDVGLKRDTAHSQTARRAKGRHVDKDRVICKEEKRALGKLCKIVFGPKLKKFTFYVGF